MTHRRACITSSSRWQVNDMTLWDDYLPSWASASTRSTWTNWGFGCSWIGIGDRADQPASLVHRHGGHLGGRVLASHGDGVYTVVVQVEAASQADEIAERYGSITRFRQGFEGEGNYLEEIDLSVCGLPLTFLSTNLP